MTLATPLHPVSPPMLDLDRRSEPRTAYRSKAQLVREPQLTKGNTCLYTVVRCEKRGDGTYSIGLHALKPLDDEWAPFTPPPAPGLDLWTKLLYLTFAIAGAATIVLLAVLWRKHQ